MIKTKRAHLDIPAMRKIQITANKWLSSDNLEMLTYSAGVFCAALVKAGCPLDLYAMKVTIDDWATDDIDTSCISATDDEKYIAALQQALLDANINPYGLTFREKYLTK